MSEATAARIAALVEAVEAQPDGELKQLAREMVRAVLDMHRDGLEAMVASLAAPGDAGAKLATAWSGDPLIAALMELHGIELPTGAGSLVALERLTAGLRVGTGGA